MWCIFIDIFAPFLEYNRKLLNAFQLLASGRLSKLQHDKKPPVKAQKEQAEHLK